MKTNNKKMMHGPLFSINFAIIWIVLGTQMRICTVEVGYKSHLNAYLSSLLGSIHPRDPPKIPPDTSTVILPPFHHIWERLRSDLWGPLTDVQLSGTRRDRALDTASAGSRTDLTRRERAASNYHCEGTMISTHYWGARVSISVW